MSLLSMIIFGSLVEAQEFKIPMGQFMFRGRLELLTAKKYEMVSLSSPAGRERLNELKRLGWICVPKTASNSQCSVFSKTEVIPASLRNQLQSKYQAMSFLFGPVNSVELINEAEALKEYLVFQQVRLNSQIAEKYRLQIIKDGPIKLQIEFAAGDKVYLNLNNERLVSGVESVTVSQNNTSTLYFIQIDFERL